MATLSDIGVSAFINILGAFAFLLAFALLRIQPINDRVYFPKWYICGKRSAPRHVGNFVGKFVNLNFKTYLTFLNWMPEAMKMSEANIIEHAGLDSAVFLRIYTLGLKIFVPTAIVALLVLIPVNVSDGTLFFLRKDLVVSDIDKLSISNIKPKSWKFFVHIAMEYLFTFWTCFMLYKEYGRVAAMRLKFLASQDKCAEQFTVLVRNVPHESKRSITDSVENFFKKNHPDHYLCHQAVYNANKFAKLVRKRAKLQNWLDYNQLKFERNPEKRPTKKKGFLGLWGEKVDSIDYYKQQLNEFDRRLTMERERILKDSKYIMPAAFVSFNSRCGAAVCAQTQQSKNPTLWLTHWAPEPRDVYWNNLSISFFSLSLRKLLISVAVFALVFFYMIPIAFVQSLANLEGLEKVAPFLRPLIELNIIKSFLQGFLPGLALKVFLFILPAILMFMSKIEGHVALSVLERRTAAKYYYFMLVNVFLGSIVAGTAFQQLHAFLHESATQIPRNIGVSIPMKATGEEEPAKGATSSFESSELRIIKIKSTRRQREQKQQSTTSKSYKLQSFAMASPHQLIVIALMISSCLVPYAQATLTPRILVKRQTEVNEQEQDLCRGRSPSEYFRLTVDDDCRDVVRCSVQGLLALRCPSGLAFDVDKQTCDWRNNVKNCQQIEKPKLATPLLATDEPLCDAGKIACATGDCLDKALFCDGKPDCVDSSDENACSVEKDPNRAPPCDQKQCVLPDCFCSPDGTQIPGKLEPSAVPQMVMISFDDAVNNNNIEIYDRIFKDGRVNPNGCSAKATFFLSHKYTNYTAVQELHRRGHEIAAHSITHKDTEKYWTEASQETWAKEMAGVRLITERFANITDNSIVGIRAPHLRVGGNNQFFMMEEQAFLYDSTITAPLSNPPLWPYTLFFRMPHRCHGNGQSCPSRSHPVWEMVMNELDRRDDPSADDTQSGCAMVDSCANIMTGDQFYNFLNHNLERHYKTNRAPLGLFFHASWLQLNPEFLDALIQWMDEVLEKKDVYFVTMTQVLQWMQSPTKLADITKFAPWKEKCDIRGVQACPQINQCALTTRELPGETIRLHTCSECPQNYPWLEDPTGDYFAWRK